MTKEKAAKPSFKLGRKARRYDPRIPHLSSLLAGVKLPPVPDPLDYGKDMPASLGEMLNDALGDCTCAGWGHQVQVWTFNASGQMLTLSDADIEALYETMGYNPSDPSTDQGCVEQDVLTHLQLAGLKGNQLAAFFEVDVRNHDDIKRTIDWCGGCYIGFDVPAFLMDLTAPGSVWDVGGKNADTSIEGGHCVLVTGFDDDGVDLISWGAKYRMTWEFWDKYVDEAYGLVDSYWVEQTGKTPAGMTLGELKQQMSAFGAQPATGAYPTKERRAA